MAAGAQTAIAAMSPRAIQSAFDSVYSTEARTAAVGAAVKLNAQPSAPNAPALPTK
jgi:hypothetical protein